MTPDKGKDQITGVYILSMDVTEEAQSRAALAQTRKRELAAQLTSGVAHDFSNLLTIIMGLQSRLAQMDIGDDAQELVQATNAAVRRGGTLLERIATISGRRDVHMEPVNIPDMLKGLESLAGPTLPANINLKVEVSDLDQRVVLDSGAVQDGILNLIINATHALGDAGGDIHLTAARSVKPGSNFV